MPICKKCKNNFPNRIIIEGKERVLSSRKYCLVCSPFGKHNTKKIHKTGATECEQCQRKYIYTKKSGHTRKICNSCVVNNRRFAQKIRMVEYKGGKCSLCGYHKCLAALGFHHLDPHTKLFTISGNHCLSWDKLKNELDKCILVCANCHKELEST